MFGVLHAARNSIDRRRRRHRWLNADRRLTFVAMVNASQPGPPTLEHRSLRSALEFAVGIAEAGQKLKPPLVFPPDLKPFLKQPRLPSSALGRVRRIIEADPEFRVRLAAGAVGELVDPIGMEWLRREDGWEERVGALIDELENASAEAEAEQAVRRAEKRREAAEQAAARTRAELVALGDRLAERERDLADLRRATQGASADTTALRNEVAAAKQAARHAGDRAEADRRRLAVIERERDEAARRATDAERQRDELLSARAEQAGIEVSARQMMELRALASSARTVADRIAALIDVPGPSRKPAALPGGVSRDSRKATEFLLTLPSALVLVDGYNVAKLMWPDLSLAEQRDRMLDAVDAVARRLGSEIAVIFDGADVVGSHATRRRLARVRYSPAGVTADDIIRAEVAAFDPARPVVVVTNDAAIRRDVAAAGANLIASNAFADLALR